MTGPENDERRPARGGVNVVQTNKHTENSASDASQDSCPTLHAEVGPRFTSWCRAARFRQLADRAGVPTTYDRQRKAWAVPTSRLSDVLVVAEHVEKRFVTVEDVPL